MGSETRPFNIETSKYFHEQARRILVDGVSSGIRKWADPVLYFDRADGPFFYDIDGNKMLDYTLGWGPLIVGSNHEAVNRAVAAQLEKGYTFGAQHKGEIALAERITAVVPGVDQVIFSNTGSEAVQAALRIARVYTGRDRIVKFEGHYHGWPNNVLVSFHPLKEDLGKPSATCAGQPSREFEDTLVLPWNDLDALEKLFADQGSEIACVITEPILANSGCCMPGDGYLAGVIDLCKRYGALSIFDEVITGFRIALGGARAFFNLSPDLSVYAKAMAGGFPMAAVGGRAEVFDVLREDPIRKP